MKPLDKLSNIEKASLLHQLFPHEIPAFIEFVEGICEANIEQTEHNRRNWDDAIYTFDLWQSLSNNVLASITEHRTRIAKRHKLFASELFEGFDAMFMVHCMALYTQVRKHPTPSFVQAVNLLFNP